MNLDLTHSIKGQSCHISFIGIVYTETDTYKIAF